jgi:glycosyltransferase involved in cell wall biosynthesis
MTHAIDVVADLTATPPSLAARALSTWAHHDSLGATARRVTALTRSGVRVGVPLPAGWELSTGESGVARAGAAIESAGRDGVPLLLLVGPVEITSEAVGALRQCLDRDPMFGFAVPRLACMDGCCLARLSRHGIALSEWVPRAAAASLPPIEFVVQMASPCILFAPDVLGNFGPLDARFESVTGAAIHYMARARRCGFRTALSNRTVVAVDGLTCDAASVQPVPEVSAADQYRLKQEVPDLERTWQEFRAGSWERFERLCTASRAGRQPAGRPSLLLDVRNVGPIYNGTTHGVLGVVRSIRDVKPAWDVSLLVHPQGAEFHDLRGEYPEWPVYTSPPDRPFTAVLRPSQPWSIREMADLHGLALFNLYMFLDTIAWDIGYVAPPHLEGIWQFLSEYSDGFLFNSEFTRDRFIERFPEAGSAPGLATHHSFDPADYVREGITRGTDRDAYILVIGNNLDHKDVQPTVEILSAAFPFHHIKVLGPTRESSPFVTASPSGTLPEADLHRLYAGARVVVFPSMYEGFGFPIVTALAYGRTVLARRSALLTEIADRCARRGRLVTFGRRDELVELLGRMFHDEPVQEHPLGAALLDGRPKTWRAVGHDTIEFIEGIVSQPWRNRWARRERAIRQFLACPPEPGTGRLVGQSS